jgi:hypothetical protein
MRILMTTTMMMMTMMMMMATERFPLVIGRMEYGPSLGMDIFIHPVYHLVAVYHWQLDK